MRLSAAGAALGAMPNARMNRALLFSLLAHALLVSLTFGGQGFGLPGLSLPWQARRTEAPDLRVVLSPPSAVVEQAPVEPSTAPAAAEAAPASKTLEAPEPVVDVAPPPDAGPALIAVDRPAAWAVPAASAVPTSVIAAMSGASSPAVEPLRQMSDALRVRSVEPAPPEVSRPEAKPLPATVVAAFASASSPAVEPLRRDALRAVDRDARERVAELAQLDNARQDTQQKAEQLEAARVDALRQEAARAEAARREAARQEAARQEALRQEAARAEAARLEGERQEAARQAAARQEAVRQEAARQEASRAEAARQEAARQEAARQEAGRQEAARQAAARLEAGRIEAAKLAALQTQAQAEAEQREARLRAIGKQLDEEAAKRDAERKRADWTPARRGRLFGRSDANEELVLYAEAFARKIQLNPTMEMVREAAKQPHTDPIVTVAVRSDGSVESITFVRSSGVPAVDDAVRRIVQSQERYQAFQPALLRDFDVVEIRRTWHFDMAIRLY